MSRRIQPIFDSILADDRCIGGTRSFVESLQEQYARKKTLSQGQRRALTRVEEQLASAPALDMDKQSRLDNLISRAQKAQDAWAVDFITSIKGQLLMGKELSTRQKEILVKVADRHSDKAQAQRESWDTNFTSEMREMMEIAARYYLANPPYFKDLATKALEDNTFIPSERAYKKMVENKFAKKVIAATLADPLYNVGSLVALRASAPSTLLYITRSILGENKTRTGKLATVIKTDAKPVTSPARGSKVYSVLFFGETSPVTVEERWIKKGKR
jgi:hypothetical protein